MATLPENEGVFFVCFCLSFKKSLCYNQEWAKNKDF